jgi:predicted nucleic acid-binding protein
VARNRPLKLVADTNVIAYFLLRTESFLDEVEAFWELQPLLLAPSVWQAEISNVLWMAARTKAIEPSSALQLQGLAARLGVEAVPIRRIWRGALARALASGVSPYDTLFVELAARERTPLVTFDAKLLTAFPDIAIRPGMLNH